MQGVVLQAKKLGKSIYIFSADAQAGKVAHVNAVSEAAKAKGVDGREWAAVTVEILGGKVSSHTRSRMRMRGNLLPAGSVYSHVMLSSAGGRQAGWCAGRRCGGRESRGSHRCCAEIL